MEVGGFSWYFYVVERLIYRGVNITSFEERELFFVVTFPGVGKYLSKPK